MYRGGLLFLGGLALGVVGTMALSKSNLKVRPIATRLMCKTLDVKDAVVSKLGAIKEDIEDIVAEARNSAEKRKNN